METVYDTIVIGSGIGGLSCASALARYGHKVLVLEQHYVAGGLTQTFTRKGFTWDVRIHYLGEMGHGGMARRNLDWLSGGAIKLAPIEGAYDIIHFPANFEIAFSGTAEVLKTNLKEKFPHSSGEIEAFFSLLRKMARESFVPSKLRALPQPLRWIYSLWAAGIVRKWWGRTTEDVLGEIRNMGTGPKVIESSSSILKKKCCSDSNIIFPRLRL